MPTVTRIVRCRLCGDSQLDLALSLRPTPIGDYYFAPERHPERLESYPLDLYLCRKCGHAQLGHLVDPEAIYSQYIYTTSISHGLTEHFRNYAESVSRKLGLVPGSFVVDIGSNDGTLLRAFKALGMRVLGVDPAPTIAKAATASGIPTVNAYFTPEVSEKIRTEHGPADLVIANNVVANVPDPEGFVRGIRGLMGDRGHFVWETGYVRYLAEGCVFDNIHHEHIDYYAVRPLIGFYERLGLVLHDVEVSESKGSSIRSFVTHRAANPTISLQVKALVANEEQRQYFSVATYQKLATKLDSIRAQLKREISEAKTAGRTVAGFGAAIGTTTMLYHFEIGPLLSYLVDDNPVRHGTCSPGLGLPVKSAEQLHGQERPALVVILAWRYADTIQKKHQAYLKAGGTFLNVLPEVERVVDGMSVETPA